MTSVTTLKTVYDPSVSGFTLPKTAAFTNFTSNSAYTENIDNFNVSGNFNKGWYFYTSGWKTGNTIFFDALGLRSTSSKSGALTSVNISGFYWSAGAYSAESGRFFNFSTNYVDAQNFSARSYGLSVRSVKEE